MHDFYSIGVILEFPCYKFLSLNSWASKRWPDSTFSVFETWGPGTEYQLEAFQKGGVTTKILQPLILIWANYIYSLFYSRYLYLENYVDRMTG